LSETAKSRPLERPSIHAFSVSRIWVPTEFQTFDGIGSDTCNLAGCENSQISTLSRDAIANPDHALLRDHWYSQDEHLRAELAALHGVPTAQVFLTSGAMGAIRYAFEVFVEAGMRVGLLRPEWPGFRFFVEHARAEALHLDTLSYPFQHQATDVIDFVRATGVKFVIFSNPSAVTGHLRDRGEVATLLAACPETFFVIDEADSIRPELSAAGLVNAHANALFLHSFSKFYGLSGLRIGYLISPEAYVSDFERTINPIELASLSILAAKAALADTVYQDGTQRAVAGNLLALSKALHNTAYSVTANSQCFATFLWAAEPLEDPDLVLERKGITIAQGKIFGISRGGRVNLSDGRAIRTLIQALLTS
jgi:histidinol-phosphate/aromatic aminotransferase/cobyric acid decarboxylase-like protein